MGMKYIHMITIFDIRYARTTTHMWERDYYEMCGLTYDSLQIDAGNMVSLLSPDRPHDPVLLTCESDTFFDCMGGPRHDTR